MSPKVVVTSLLGDVGPHFELLGNAGLETEVVDRKLDLNVEDNMILALRDADACIAGSEPITARVISSCPKLRVIARTGVGFDAVHLPTCDQKRIVVATTPGVNHHAVAEHTIAMLMSLARNLPQRDREVRRGNWQKIPSPRVMGRTLGLVGLGRIGRAVATCGTRTRTQRARIRSLPQPRVRRAMAGRIHVATRPLVTLGLRVVTLTDGSVVAASYQRRLVAEDEARINHHQHRSRAVD